MFRNYVTTALRNLSKNKLHALINIIGLSMGLAVFVFAQLFADYERNHDGFFAKSARIYAIYGVFQPTANIGIRLSQGIQTAVVPLIEGEVPAVEAAARLLAREYLAHYGDKKFYQDIRFADPAFLDIFDFDYFHGDGATALDDPSGLIITRTAARKYFGTDDAMGKVITFNTAHDLHVTAVIADIPANSHFTASLIGDAGLDMIANTTALAAMSDWKIEGGWDNWSGSDISYVLLREGVSPATVNQQLAGLYDRHLPDDEKEFLASYDLTPLKDINLYLWETSGIPVITSIQVLGLMILVIAILNYTNLATAQVMGRSREVGIRRCMGASRSQLFTQFLAESMVLSVIAMIVAVTVIQTLLPVINDATGKIIEFDLLSHPARLGGLAGLVLLVGAAAGGYPAHMISRGGTVGLLNGVSRVGKRAGLVRGAMVAAQFSIALFMIIVSAIIYAQNRQIAGTGAVFAKDRIVTLGRVGRPEIKGSIETLRRELERVPGVGGFALSSQVPFEQSHSTGKFSPTTGDEAQDIDLYNIRIDRGFLKVYGITLLAGRNFSVDRALDVLATNDQGETIQDVVNAIVNQSTLAQLAAVAPEAGFGTPQEAIGKRFYRSRENKQSLEIRIIGIIPDINFLGFFNAIKPTVFINRPDSLGIASLRIEGASVPRTLAAIDATWERIVPDFPIERRFLDDYFNDIYGILRGMNVALGGFALMALIVAVIGLFGMAAFMARRRTREIGLRKVMGARTPDVVRLMLWDISRPVFIAIFIAAPLAYWGSGLYLNFFAERVGMTPLPFLGAGLAVVAVAWATISLHAFRVARANPIHALRYE